MASRARIGAVLTGWLAIVNGAPAQTVAVKDVVAEYMGDGLELAVIPTPRDARLSDRMLVAPRFAIEAPARYARTATLKDATRWAESLAPKGKGAVKVLIGELGDGSAADRLLTELGLVPAMETRKVMGEQGYVLYAGVPPRTKVPVIAIAGGGPAGTYYGLQTLRQLTVVKGGKVYVRTGRIVDWPAMPWRGSKRPLAWEELFKANFGALRGDDQKEHFRVYFGAGADPQRGLKSWEIAAGARKTAGRGLDVSDAYIDWLFAQWRDHYKKTGNPLFTIKGDDIELELDEKSGTRRRFKGDFGAAFVHLLRELNRRLKALDARCTLYWMPNPYYTVNWDFERLSNQVRDAGGLPGDVGLWWTGHYVFSDVLTEADVTGYQKAFYRKKPVRVRGVIYDNHGRDAEPSGRLADYFAMPERDPRIAKHLNGIINERGSFINRITSYDFQWHPEAYNAERSLKLAVRELANRDPAYYRLLLEFVRTWEAERYPVRTITSHAAAKKQQEAAVARLKKLGARLRAVGPGALEKATVTWDARDGDFRKQFLASVLASIKQKEALLRFVDSMWRDANGPAYIIDARDAPKIDGKLDDDCYRRKPTFDRFITRGARMLDGKKPLWELPAGVVPADIATEGWFFADDRNFYMAFRCRDRPYARPAGARLVGPTPRAKIGNDHPYCWRQWCLDVNLDVKHDKRNTFHVIFDPLGQVYDEYLGWPGAPVPTGPAWTIGNNFKVVRDGDTWTVEAAIPLASLGLAGVKPGDVWGANVYRNGMNAVSMFSLLQDTGPYGVRYPKVFGYVHWK
jgi:hypothetical protein